MRPLRRGMEDAPAHIEAELRQAEKTLTWLTEQLTAAEDRLARKNDLRMSSICRRSSFSRLPAPASLSRRAERASSSSRLACSRWGRISANSFFRARRSSVYLDTRPVQHG